MQERLEELNRVIGATHVLVRCAKAEAASANARDAERTLKEADNLLMRGHITDKDFMFGGDE
jgi:hypothetical protein